MKGITMVQKLILIVFMFFSMTAIAAEKITLLWGFSPASNQAVFYRAMVMDLNKNQTKYEFIFDTKPGASGAIAAKYILNNPQNALLGASSTFFIRSNFDKDTGYDVENFQPVFIQALGAPVAFFSTKYPTIRSLKRDQDLTTSISGYGSHSNLLASILGEHFLGTRIIRYTSLVDANKDILGQHIDTGWNWLGDIEGPVVSRMTNVLGLTGTRSVNGHPTLTSQGIKGFDDMSTNTSIFASAAMLPERVRELYELLRIANKATDVQAGYAREYSISADVTLQQTVIWFNQQVKFWREQSTKVKPLQ